MELVEGRTLAALLEARKDPADDRVRFLSVFEQVCQTMAYAHARGVIHRDLKPSNVMVGSFGEVQVMDWGLAKVLDQGGVADEVGAQRTRNDSGVIRTDRTGSQAGASRAGVVLGTPAYMAPEQARGAIDTIDERADVFGLGSILCEILTGKPTFTGRTDVELYEKAERAELGDALARLDACGGDGELVGLARSCLAAAPEERPRDAGAVAAGLTAYLASAEQRLRAADLARAQAEAHAAAESRLRHLTVALAASILAIVVLAGGGWARWARDRAARAVATSLAVNQALDDAVKKRDRARSTRGGDLTLWVEAIVAARRAEVMLQGGEDRPDLHHRVQSVLASINHEREQAEAAEKDRRTVERLARIHDDLGVHMDWHTADDQYAAAFRNYGVDLDGLEPIEAGTRLAASPVAIELANALDQWAFLRIPHHRRRPSSNAARRLVTVAKAADPDPWRNRVRDALYPADTDRDQPRDALLKLAAAADPENLPEASVTRLAFALSRPELGATEMAIALLRRAQRVHPNDFWLNIDLARLLMRTGELEDAICCFSVAVSIRPQSELALHGLGTALQQGRRFDDAAATFRQAIRLMPDSARLHVSLGVLLCDKKHDYTRAAAEFGLAIRLEPNYPSAHYNLGLALRHQGKSEEAITAFRTAIRLMPDFAPVHHDLGLALGDREKPDEAITAFREAIRLKPEFAAAHLSLGAVLNDWKHDHDGAVAEFREVIRLEPNSADAHYNLGTALGAQGKSEEAIAAFREAIRHKPDVAQAHCNLGQVLHDQRRYSEALVELRRGHELGLRLPNWRYPSAQWVRDCERHVALSARLPVFVNGEVQPADAAERLVVAQMCSDKALHAAAVRFWTDAFQADARLADDIRAGNRQHAARSAALAGCGRGQDHPPPDDQARRRLRRQALDWLEAELAVYDQLLESRRPRDRDLVTGRLDNWRRDSAFAPLRGEAALGQLPEPERLAWQTFWSKVEALRRRVLQVDRTTNPPAPS
jgi:serine/threonine-protein kinase